LKVTREKTTQKGGYRPKLSVGEQLFLTLQYWRECRTMAHIAYDFGVAKNTVSDIIRQVENTLIQNGTFHLPGKNRCCAKNAGRILVMDVTETPKKQKRRRFTILYILE
jgi:hypothetical protein